MQDKGWVDTAEEIFRSVFSAVENQDYAGLSKDIEYKVNKVVDKVNVKMDSLNQKINANVNQWGTKPTGNRTEAFKEKQQAKKKGQSTAIVKQQPQLYAKNPPGTYSGPACTVLGITGTSIFAPGTLVLSLIGLVTGNPWVWFADILSTSALAGSIGMLAGGIKKKAFVERFKSYVKQIGNRQYCDVEQLATVVGKKKGFVLRDLRKMIGKGFFLQGHLDDTGNTLITSDEVYQNYLDAEQSRRNREIWAIEQANKEKGLKENDAIQIREIKYEEYPEEVRNVLNEGEKYIQQIREANDAIPGEVMSQKLDTLEDIMKRIFEQLKKDPTSVDDLQKLMKYYLPTTAKLIEAYKELDGKPSYGEQNIANTKKEIEDTMDVINDAFGKIFDDMFQDAAWDISTEISTMKTILAKEGLTGGKDFEIQKQTK